jgi:hypothetical protein
VNSESWIVDRSKFCRVGTAHNLEFMQFQSNKYLHLITCLSTRKRRNLSWWALPTLQLNSIDPPSTIHHLPFTNLHSNRLVTSIYIDDLSSNPTSQIASQESCGITNLSLSHSSFEWSHIFNVVNHIQNTTHCRRS